jgi:hypothetical protein
MYMCVCVYAFQSRMISNDDRFKIRKKAGTVDTCTQVSNIQTLSPKP